jgi:hypothetical protein
LRWLALIVPLAKMIANLRGCTDSCGDDSVGRPHRLHPLEDDVGHIVSILLKGCWTLTPVKQQRWPCRLESAHPVATADAVQSS